MKKAHADTIADLVRDNTKCNATAHLWEGEARIPADTDIVINATSVGFGNADAMAAVDVETFKKGQVVADVIPNPPMTRFLRESKKRGCTPLDGLGMLVNQGVIGVELWLGKTLDATVMQRTLSDIFNTSDAE